MSSPQDGATLLQRDGYPAGVPCWVDTSQPDPYAAVRFYSSLFGWEFEDRMPADAPGSYLVAQLGGCDVAAVGSAPESLTTAVWNTYVWVDSADETVAAAKAAGGRVVDAPFDVGDAGRMAVLADPAGGVFCVWQAKGHKGAQLVNAPGTWSFSDLNTPDVEAAKAFYGAVFGWEPSVVDFGDGIGTGVMWRRPGYGDHLQRIDPGVRDRHSDAGAPEGFTDAVAWLMHQDGPAHWAVTFAVDDTDAMAARAAELGATIVAPPYDAGPVRVALIQDPQGAMFSISRYSPE